MTSQFPRTGDDLILIKYSSASSWSIKESIIMQPTLSQGSVLCKQRVNSKRAVHSFLLWLLNHLILCGVRGMPPRRTNKRPERAGADQSHRSSSLPPGEREISASFSLFCWCLFDFMENAFIQLFLLIFLCVLFGFRELRCVDCSYSFSDPEIRARYK